MRPWVLLYISWKTQASSSIPYSLTESNHYHCGNKCFCISSVQLTNQALRALTCYHVIQGGIWWWTSDVMGGITYMEMPRLDDAEFQ